MPSHTEAERQKKIRRLRAEIKRLSKAPKMSKAGREKLRKANKK